MATVEVDEEEMLPTHSSRSGTMQNMTPFASSTPLNTQNLNEIPQAALTPQVQLTELNLDSLRQNSRRNGSQHVLPSQISSQTPSSKNADASQNNDSDDDGDKDEAEDEEMGDFLATERDTDFSTQGSRHTVEKTPSFSVDISNDTSRLSQSNSNPEPSQGPSFVQASHPGGSQISDHDESSSSIVQDLSFVCRDADPVREQPLCSGSDSEIGDLSN